MNNIQSQITTMILKEEDQVKAYLHPKRMALLKMLAKEKMTISGAAKVFQVHPANLTHHFKALEKVGLINLVEKVNNGKTLEKYYQAVAMNFIIRPEGEKLNKKALVLSALKDSLSTAIETVKEDDGKFTLGLLNYARLNQEQAVELMNRINELMQEFTTNTDPQGQTYVLNISFYPSDISYDMIPKEEIHIT